MKTNLFRKNYSSPKWGMRMMRLALLLLPLRGRGLGGGCMLFAQNGVTVSNLAVSVDSPTTVTFNVSWKNTGMPALWSDTVWVFVDYNNAGKIERLPLSPGATLTATSPGGKVIEEPDNNKGVWVVGNARDAGAFSATVQLLTAVKDVGGACVYGSNYPPVAKYITDQTIQFTGTPPYDLVLSTGTDQAYGNYNLLANQRLWSFTDATGAPGILSAINQPQGGCTFTQPPLVGTFASFDNNYSASTYVTLTDERDSKNYAVVKINNRWWMAQNLNYQVGLTYWNRHDLPNSTNGPNLEIRGGFWCPANSNPVDITVCDYWGALYAWETAMMLDGKGIWTETTGSSGYCTGAANTDACKQNWGRTASSGTTIGGRGICPPNWHVPTDFELGVLMDGMESSGGTTHQTTSVNGNWVGTDAGTRGKAKCSGSSSDTNPTWSSGAGTDNYNFRGIASDERNGDGTMDSERGRYAALWSSSVTDNSAAWYLAFSCNVGVVSRRCYPRSFGHSIRCVRD
jgi:uncharacterized protein (TIGR02145 family)